MNGGWQILGRDILELGRVQLEPLSLRGLVGTADGPVVELESRHVGQAVVPWRPLLLLLIFSGPNMTNLSFEQDRSLYMANLGAAPQSSRVVSRWVLVYVWEQCVVSARGTPRAPSSHRSHALRTSFKERLLLASTFPGEHQLLGGTRGPSRLVCRC